MTSVRRLSRFALALSFVTSALFLLSACEVYDGDLPETDELQTPMALAVHPSGRYLYVLNSNFSGLYRDDLGGSLSVVDLDALRILPDRTRCLPSFGGGLAFSATTYSEDEPRFLFASTKSNRGGVSFELSEEGDQLRCLYQGEDVGPTCVKDIRSIPGVTRKRRYLPCEIRNIVDEPSAVTAIPPIVGETPLDQDAFAIVSQTTGEIRAINLIDGEIRGHEAKGEQRRGLHITDEEFYVSPGTITSAVHPVTGETYYGSRSDNRFFITRWAREAVGDVAVNPRQGFATHVARMGVALINSSSTYQEIRGLAFSADGNRLYAVSQNPSSLITIDTSLNDEGKARNLFIRRHVIAGRLGGIALVEHPDATLAYLTLYKEREIAVVDVATGTRLSTIAVGATPYAIVPDPTRPLVYAALFEENAVAVIDTDASSPTFNRVITTIR